MWAQRRGRRGSKKQKDEQPSMQRRNKNEKEHAPIKKKKSGIYKDSREMEDVPLSLNEDGLVTVIGKNFYGQDKTEDGVKAFLSYRDAFGWQHAANGDFAAWNTALGNGIKVAVIDSGATTSHPDLAYAGTYNAFSVNFLGSTPH